MPCYKGCVLRALFRAQSRGPSQVLRRGLGGCFAIHDVLCSPEQLVRGFLHFSRSPRCRPRQASGEIWRESICPALFAGFALPGTASLRSRAMQRPHLTREEPAMVLHQARSHPVSMASTPSQHAQRSRSRTPSPVSSPCQRAFSRSSRHRNLAAYRAREATEGQLTRAQATFLQTSTFQSRFALLPHMCLFPTSSAPCTLL